MCLSKWAYSFAFSCDTAQLCIRCWLPFFFFIDPLPYQWDRISPRCRSSPYFTPFSPLLISFAFFFFFNAQGYFIGIADCWKRAHKKKWLSIAPVSLDVCCSTDGDNKKKSLKSWEQTSKHTNKQTHTHQRKEKKKENRRSKARLRQFQAMRAGVNSFLFVCL